MNRMRQLIIWTFDSYFQKNAYFVSASTQLICTEFAKLLEHKYPLWKHRRPQPNEYSWVSHLTSNWIFIRHQVQTHSSVRQTYFFHPTHSLIDSFTEVFCDVPALPAHGYLQGDRIQRFRGGDIVQFTCDSGYMLEGNPIVICQESGRWSGPPPNCEFYLHSLKNILHTMNKHLTVLVYSKLKLIYKKLALHC